MTLKTKIATILGKPSTSYVLIIIVLAMMLAPIIFTAFTSFKSREETFRWPPTYFPEEPTLQAYHEVLFRSPMVRHLLNSLIVALGTTAIVIAGGAF